MREPKRETKSWGFRTFNGERYQGLGIASTLKGAQDMAKQARKDGYLARVTAVRHPNGNGVGTHIAYMYWARRK